MSATTMSRPFNKTYSRSVRKEDRATKAFDDAILGVTGNKPCTVKAASTIEKWGKTSFTSTRGSSSIETEEPRKRKRNDADDDDDSDPFSFDLEDVGPSKAKRGMGYRVPDKTKPHPKVATVFNKNSESLKKDVCKVTQLGSKGGGSDLLKCDRGGESGDDGDGLTIVRMQTRHTQSRMKIASKVKASGKIDSSNKSVNDTKSAETTTKKQTLMDKFTTNKTYEINKNIKESAMTKQNLKQIQKSQSTVPKKFFVTGTTRERKNDQDVLDVKSLMGSETKESASNKKNKFDFNQADVVRDEDFDDPEVIFNSSKKTKDDDFGMVDSLKKINGLQSIDDNKRGAPDESSLTSSLKKTYQTVSEKSVDAKKVELDNTKSLNMRKAVVSVSLFTGRRNVIKSKEATCVRSLLTRAKKTETKNKASYNHRQWQISDDDDEASKGLPSSGSQNPTNENLQKTKKEVDVGMESSDEELIKSPTVLYRSIRNQKLQSGEPVAGIKVIRRHKPLFMVVRNVKQAHECQEYGETQEFTDDIEYIMDGLIEGQALSIRSLSAVSLVNKCTSHAFRMHMRAHGELTKVFTALHDAPKHPTLALCLAAVMYMMSRDRLTLELDELNLKLILQVLSADTDGKRSSESKEYENIRQKIYSFCNGFDQNGRVERNELLLSDTTAGHLAMEALLRLTSKRDGDWFKDALRTLGGLDHIADTVCKCIRRIDNAALELDDSAICTLTKIDRCYRVLENVTYLKSENQNHLITYNSSILIDMLNNSLELCERCLPFNELSKEGEKVDKTSHGYIIYSSLLATLRVLINLTHDNDVGCAKIGQKDGLIKTILTCILRLPRFLPNAERFDVLVLGLGLLVNLVEHSLNNLRILLNSPTVVPFDQYPSINGTLSSLEALGMLFSLRFEAAKMFEEEHDAELDEKERRRQDMMTMKGGGGVEDSGLWQESDSGIQWIATDDKGRKKVKDSTNDDDDDASNDGEMQMMNSQSQADSKSFTKALHKAGSHMEDSIVAAYVALLIGCVIQHNLDLAEKVRDTLPDCSFDPMIRMLRKFLGFMNLTSGSSAASSSKSIIRVLEVLENC